MTARSVVLTPAALSSTSTSPSPGTGSGSSRMLPTCPNPSIANARILASSCPGQTDGLVGRISNTWPSLPRRVQLEDDHSRRAAGTQLEGLQLPVHHDHCLEVDPALEPLEPRHDPLIFVEEMTPNGGDVRPLYGYWPIGRVPRYLID